MLQTLQQEFGAFTVMKIRWIRLVHQQCALRVDDLMALAALHLLGAIAPSWSTHLRGFDRLPVDDRRCGLRIAANPTAVALPQNLVTAPKCYPHASERSDKYGAPRGSSCVTSRH